MNIIKAYYILNLKMLNRDKLTFIWSIAIPTAFVMMNRSYIDTLSDMRFYWTYTIVSAYMFGIGMNAIRQREMGSLRTCFSIKPARVEFFVSLVLTQITFCLISLLGVNIFANLMFGFNIFIMMLQSAKLIILALPLCFLSFGMTLLNKVHADTMNTIISIGIIVFCILAGSNEGWNQINPIVFIGNLLVMDNIQAYLSYVVVSVIAIGIGLYSIKNYTVLSVERR